MAEGSVTFSTITEGNVTFCTITQETTTEGNATCTITEGSVTLSTITEGTIKFCISCFDRVKMLLVPRGRTFVPGTGDLTFEVQLSRQ